MSAESSDPNVPVVRTLSSNPVKKSSPSPIPRALDGAEPARTLTPLKRSLVLPLALAAAAALAAGGVITYVATASSHISRDVDDLPSKHRTARTPSSGGDVVDSLTDWISPPDSRSVAPDPESPRTAGTVAAPDPSPPRPAGSTISPALPPSTPPQLHAPFSSIQHPVPVRAIAEAPAS